MSEYQNLIFENQGGIGVITVNRPQAPNALNADTAYMQPLSAADGQA